MCLAAFPDTHKRTTSTQAHTCAHMRTQARARTRTHAHAHACAHRCTHVANSGGRPPAAVLRRSPPQLAVVRALCVAALSLVETFPWNYYRDVHEPHMAEPPASARPSRPLSEAGATTGESSPAGSSLSTLPPWLFAFFSLSLSPNLLPRSLAQ